MTLVHAGQRTHPYTYALNTKQIKNNNNNNIRESLARANQGRARKTFSANITNHKKPT